MSETPEFKSRRVKGEALVEEARQAREAKQPVGSSWHAGCPCTPVFAGADWGKGDRTVVVGAQPRHPATMIGE